MVKIDKMTEDDLPGVMKLNNKFIDAVGKISLKKLDYLLKTSA